MVSSQKTNSVRRLSARTSPSIEAMKIRMNRKKRGRAAVAVQVAAGIEHDQRADAADQQREGQAQSVQIERQVDVQSRYPGDDLAHRLARCDFRDEAHEPDGHRSGNYRQDPSREMRQSACDNWSHQRPYKDAENSAQHRRACSASSMLPLRLRLPVDFVRKDAAYMGPDRFVSSASVLFDFYEKETILCPATACHARSLPFQHIVPGKGRQVQGC